MKNEVYYPVERIRTGTANKSTKILFAKTLKTQVSLCILLIIVLGIISITSDGKFEKTKNTVKLVLTQNADVVGQLNKIKSIFTTEKSIDNMTPVAEFVNPAPEGVVSAGFGVQDANNSGFHYGVDIKMNSQKNIISAATGEVTEIATNEELGTYVIIKHSDEIFTTYARLGEILPDVGEKVEGGKTIARVNDTDNTFYFEIRRNDTYLDPTEFIDFGDEK
jgi:murein DD-endopeptidase MepM/ murein hydrolase activator NlpD